jgi:hypothetical protein
VAGDGVAGAKDGRGGGHEGGHKGGHEGGHAGEARLRGPYAVAVSRSGREAVVVDRCIFLLPTPVKTQKRASFVCSHFLTCLFLLASKASKRCIRAGGSEKLPTPVPIGLVIPP